MYLYRIVTFMAHTHGQAPQHMLEAGSMVIEYGDPERVFTVRKVFYDDDFTPLYSEPKFNEQRFIDLNKLKEAHPHKLIWDHPILDKDFSLKVWNNDNP
jgi:hypothetical protein